MLWSEHNFFRETRLFAFQFSVNPPLLFRPLIAPFSPLSRLSSLSVRCNALFCAHFHIHFCCIHSAATTSMHIRNCTPDLISSSPSFSHNILFIRPDQPQSAHSLPQCRRLDKEIRRQRPLRHTPTGNARKCKHVEKRTILHRSLTLAGREYQSIRFIKSRKHFHLLSNLLLLSPALFVSFKGITRTSGGGLYIPQFLIRHVLLPMHRHSAQSMWFIRFIVPRIKIFSQLAHIPPSLGHTR